jgi:hypothetical protein
MANFRYITCCAVLIASSASASIVTTASCKAVTATNTVLYESVDTLSCFGSATTPGTPFIAYNVSAEVTSARVVADARGGFWDDMGNVSATAMASAIGTDTVVFPGAGLATLRLTLATQMFGPLGTAGMGYTYSVNGVSRVAPISMFGTTFTERDYQISLGNDTAIRWAAQVLAAAGSMTHEAGGLLFGAPQMRLYNSNGDQMRGVVGVGTDASYSIFFSESDTSRGPTLASVPEPSAFSLMALVVMLYCVRKLRSCSLLPQVA